ncbi:Thermostable monoacylglycerol lipase [Halioglobus japonicus]|nr:Thermostable monoacylglycerol lipase [Halioglobus japonicus]
MPWHTEILENEYSSDMANDITSLTDYLQLEEVLFDELEQKIYAPSATGPAEALERYSKGSLADPQQRHPNWNRTFELGNDAPEAGVLLLHGMSDSPYSLRALGETLQRRGFSVLGLRMPGHGTLPSGLLDLQWQDMAAVVELGMMHLAQQAPGKRLYIIGYSTGAALALDYVLKYSSSAEPQAGLPPVTRLVLISPAIGVSPAAALAKWSRRLSQLPGLDRLAWLDIAPEFDPYKYNSFATNAGEQVYELTRSVANRLASRPADAPPLPQMLILKSTVDATVSNNAVVDRLLLKLPPERDELVVFDINRVASNASLLINDPGPFTTRMIDDQQLPFTLTLVTNSSANSRDVTAYTKLPYAAGHSHTESLEQAWPASVFSLSHVALPFPPNDSLYGKQQPSGDRQIFLGQQAMQGERGVLKIPGDFLLRLRHNPFYQYMQTRVLQWLQ